MLAGKTVGQAVNQNCSICRRYLAPNGDTVYRGTSFYYRFFHMPLCNQDRLESHLVIDLTCKEEHNQQTTICPSVVGGVTRNGTAQLVPWIKST
jgi:hypothetical protein